MFRSAIALVLGASSFAVMAQMTPVGLWKTIDDKDSSVRSEVRIIETQGVLSGVIEKTLKPSAEPNCDLCADDRKGKPKLGMEIIRGAKKTEGKEVWEGGKILDPDNGKEYTLRLTPIEDGKKLEVRGYIAFFFRTQTWVRVP
jgi:uncharacterized protein (DUF2147 family)